MCNYSTLLGLIVNTIYHVNIEHVVKQTCYIMGGWVDWEKMIDVSRVNIND